MSALTPVGHIERLILFIRGHKVILDRDLADRYGVSTKILNQAVRRNQDRFPHDFMFRLTREEKEKVVTNCDYLRILRFSPVSPCAFTEHGALMLANILKSPTAVQSSILIVRAFVGLREMIASHVELSRRLDDLEKKYDKQFRSVFEAIRELMLPPESPPRRRIGFNHGEDS